MLYVHTSFKAAVKQKLQAQIQQIEAFIRWLFVRGIQANVSFKGIALPISFIFIISPILMKLCGYIYNRKNTWSNSCTLFSSFLHRKRVIHRWQEKGGSAVNRPAGERLDLTSQFSHQSKGNRLFYKGIESSFAFHFSFYVIMFKKNIQLPKVVIFLWKFLKLKKKLTLLCWALHYAYTDSIMNHVAQKSWRRIL